MGNEGLEAKAKLISKLFGPTVSVVESLYHLENGNESKAAELLASSAVGASAGTATTPVIVTFGGTVLSPTRTPTGFLKDARITQLNIELNKELARQAYHAYDALWGDLAEKQQDYMRALAEYSDNHAFKSHTFRNCD